MMVAVIDSSLPTAIIIGAQRCGTTRFFNLLREHPGVASSLRKEVHFYDLRFGRGLDWYRSAFPNSGDGIGLDASPYYIYHPLCAERIYSCQPDVKIIALLRNPVDRAYSNYHHERRTKHEKLTFEEALVMESHRTLGEEQKIIDGEGTFSARHVHCSYLQRSTYLPQLKRYYDLFERGNIMLIRTEDFFADEQGILLDVQEFIGLEPIPQEIETFVPKEHHKYPAIEPGIREKLLGFFEPYNRELAEFVGRDFDWNE